jgi:hypothetical protein
MLQMVRMLQSAGLRSTDKKETNMHGAVWHRPRAEIAREVILRRTPSHVVNLAAFIRWLVAAAVIVVGYVFALNRWPVP